jgi:cellulose synthase/poly-beta-1,6-N-acetylglucosamine synthase-like glycosyltransferase
MRVVVVPDGAPRTKPRALNFALGQATGDYVVVYDAEDVPDGDQLRRALARLRVSPELGCVQARLNVYNAGESWLTRQFAIEYTALFDCLLPALERLRLPVPLGGTSNHFPRKVLEEVGGWDPYNVTEDADLGIRLARGGWRVEVLASTTWEEAPVTLKTWLGQRKRWLKGWMQTYLVHMRQPRRLLRELGGRSFLGLQVLMGGLLLSALVHPWYYVLAALDAAYDILAVSGETAAGRLLWWLGLFNLVTGYVTGVALGGMATTLRGWRGLATHALLMPAYWLLISYAAYEALWQFVTAPYYWEKTEHSARRHAILDQSRPDRGA